jgi:peptidoglycan hydrolase CwlO-like protein
LYSQTKADKEKLEIKIESLVNDHNKKDKDLMSITHSRDQLANNLEKKENKIKELETEMQSQKDSMTEQI